MNEYWRISVEEALEDAGLEASDSQIKTIVDSMETASEMESEATGQLNIPNPIDKELSDTRQELKREQNKTICPECKGEGRIITNGPCCSSNSQCWKCQGAGFLYD